MKKTFGMMMLLLVAVLMASCDKLFGGGSGMGYEVTAIAFQEEENGDWGLMDMDGNVLVKPKFKGYVTAVINGAFSVLNEEDSEYTLYVLDGDKPRKIGTYQDVGAFTGNLCPVTDKNNNMKYVDKEGNSPFDIKKIKGKKVVSAFNFFCGLAMVKLENDKWGYINEQGETVVPFKYADAWNFVEDLAVVYLDPQEDEGAKWGVIDTQGQMLFTKKFSDMEPSAYRYYNGLMPVVNQSDGRTVLLDREGKTVKKMKEGVYVGAIYDEVFTVYDQENEKTYLMDVDGKSNLKGKYESLSYNGPLLVGSTDRKRNYLLNLEGEKLAKLPDGYVTLFEPEYKNYDNRFLVGEYEQGYKLLDGQGNEVETKADLFNVSSGYYYGASVRMEEEEEYYEDYEE